LVSVNKLKAHQNPIITVITIIIITQDENKILSNKIPRRIIGRRRTHFYECFKFNEHKGKTKHNKNYNGKIIVALPKKGIRYHKQHISDMTIHYDMTIQPIFRIRVIPLNEPLWSLIPYPIHQENNYLQKS
jgi:hypothetical protein